MTHDEFIADFVLNNTPQPGQRVLGSALTVDQAKAKAELLWAASNTPNNILARTLEAAGGSGWNSADLSKKRVYFNGPESVVGLNETVYFDVLAGTWHDRAGAQLSAAAEAAARAVIGV